MKEENKSDWKMKIGLGITITILASINFVAWFQYLPSPIEESGIAYYTIDGAVYNLYLYPYGVFLGEFAKGMIFSMFGLGTVSVIYIFIVYCVAQENKEPEYINVYVLRKCGTISLYMNDSKIGDKSLYCWKNSGIGKLDSWILSEMEYFINKFEFNRGCCRFNSLTANLKNESFMERYKFPLIILGIVLSFLFIACLLPVGMLEFLSTPW